jgi:hypothetical protein
MERKNPFGIVDAFRRAFAQGEDATLVIKTTPPYPLSFAKNLKSYVAGFRDLKKLSKASSGRIIILDEHVTQTDFVSLVSACDCLVSLHRAEGFIATGYSGNLDYMTNENSLLVRHTIVPVGRKFEAFGPGPERYTWAEPDVDHASSLMRWVFEHRDEARALGGKASEDVRGLMNPARVGQEIRS